MKYIPAIAAADLGAGRTGKTGTEDRLKYSISGSIRSVGTVKLSAAATGELDLDESYSGLGADLQAVLLSANPAIAEALVLVLAVTRSDDTTGLAVAKFLPPTYAPDQDPHMPQGIAVDILSAAKAVLTSDNTNVADSATVTLGNKIYTFKTALTPLEGEVLIGGSADASLLNLIRAVNHTGTPDTDYKCAAAHTQIIADAAVAAHAATFHATKVPGLAGNDLASTEVSTHLSFGGLVFAGGALTFKSVGSLSSVAGGTSGVEVEILELPVASDWKEIEDPVQKNIIFGSVGSVPIASRYKAAKYVKKGRGDLPTVSVSSNYQSFASGLPRLCGHKIALMFETWDDDRVLVQRIVVRTVLKVARPAGGDEAVIASGEGVAEHIAVFV